MAPSAVSYTHEESTTNGDIPPVATAKMQALPHTTAVPVGNGTKQETIQEMAGNWSDFSFNHIRESQVSRECTLALRLMLDLLTSKCRRHDPPLLCGS